MNTERRRFFELTGPMLEAHAKHVEKRMAAINAGDAFARNHTGCAGARMGFSDNGDADSFFLPTKAAAEGHLPGGANWAKLFKHVYTDADGAYYRPRNNSNASKNWGKLLRELPKAPTTWHFVKEYLPGFCAQCVLGHYFVKAVMVDLAGHIVLALPDCECNAKAKPPEGAQHLRPSQVLAWSEEAELTATKA